MASPHCGHLPLTLDKGSVTVCHSTPFESNLLKSLAVPHDSGVEAFLLLLFHRSQSLPASHSVIMPLL